MSKPKLKEMIENLEKIRQQYKKKYGKEPQVWDIDSFSDDIEAIDLCHSYRKGKGGIGHTASDIETYTL